MHQPTRSISASSIARTGAGCAVAGFLSAAAALAAAGIAAAQPVPPPMPPPPPPALPAPPPAAPGPSLPVLGQLGPYGLAVMGQTGQPAANSFGMPAVVGLDPSTVLGQTPVPSAPGAGPGTPPNLNPFNNAYGLGQNLVPSAPGEGVQFDVPPGQENADVSKREWFGRFIDMYRDGQLKGGLLGRVPKEQLSQPFPGTAPPPGVNLPPGPEQFYVPPGTVPPVDPAAPVPPIPPVPPPAG